MKKVFLYGIMFLFCFPNQLLAQQAQYFKTANGVQYRFVKQLPNKRKAQLNDIVDFVMAIRNGKDSLVKPNANLKFKVQEKYGEDGKYSPVEVFNVVAEQDSVEVLVSVDSLKKSPQGAYLPPALSVGSFVKYYIKIEKISSLTELEKGKKQKDSLQNVTDLKEIKKYILTNKLQAKATASGLHYVIEKQGTGTKPAKGQTVVVHYTGTLLSGTKFDSSLDRNQPFDFPLGVGRVIKGWDEGIALLNVGTKAKFIIPSALAYGENGAGSIPPNAILIFDVELIEVK